MIVVKLFDYMNPLKTNSLQEKIKCPLLKYFAYIFHLRKKFGWEGGLSGKFKPIKFTLQIYMPCNFILRKPPPPPYNYRIRAWHCLELYTRCCLFSYQDKNWIINTSIPNEVFRICGITDFLPKCLWIILEALFTHELTVPTNYETIFINYLRN